MQFEDLEVWKKARELTGRIYNATRRGAFAKDYGLRDQIRRASVSVMSNIAEGYERDGNQEFIHFLSIAKGSSGEVRAQLYVAYDQRYIDKADFVSFAGAFRKLSVMISNFIKYLKGSPLKGQKYKKPPRKTMKEEMEEILKEAAKKNKNN